MKQLFDWTSHLEILQEKKRLLVAFQGLEQTILEDGGLSFIQ